MSNAKRNICFVIRGVTTFGGKERVLSGTVNSLAPDLGKIYVVTLDGSSIPAFPFQQGIEVVPLQASNAFGKANILAKVYGYLKDFYFLRSALRRLDADVIVGLDYIVSILLVFCRLSGVPGKVAAWEHMTLRDPGMKPILKKVRNFIYKQLDAIVVLTNGDDAVLKRINVPFYCIPNAVSFRSEVKSQLRNRQILTIARFCNQKGIDLWLEVVSRIANEPDGWNFLLVGQAGDFTRDWIAQRALEKNISEYVNIEDARENVAELYLHSSIYLMTSRYEGLPMVLIEAMEYGLPCVSFDCPTGPSDIITEGTNGFLVECFDLEVMEEKLRRLMRSYDMRKAFSDSAASSLDRFSPKFVNAKWLHFFDQIISD